MHTGNKDKCGCCGGDTAKCNCNCGNSHGCGFKSRCKVKSCISLILGAGLIVADTYFHFWGGKPWDNGIAAVGILFILLSSHS